MAHKIRVPKTKSHTKYMCSECEKPVDFQGTKCAFCKADMDTAPNWKLWLNLLFIAVFAAFSYVMMN